MFLYTPNLVMVVLAAAVGLAIGAVWYSRPMFGRLWSQLMGREMGAPVAGYRRNLVIFVVATLIEAYVTAHLVYYVGAYSWFEGAVAGLWFWLGFVATNFAVGTAFGGQSTKIWLVDAGCQLLTLMAMGAILASW